MTWPLDCTVSGGRRARSVRGGLLIAALGLAALGAAGVFLLDRGAMAQVPARAPGEIVRVFGLGGVLTSDGTLWQFRPDKKQWLTIDEAFRTQGQETRVLPLPVKPEKIREMATWGFILTDSGSCWLYDLDENRWVELPPPGK